MIQPPLANACKLEFKPARHNVDRNSAVGVMVDASYLLRSHSWIPRPRQQCSNQLDLLGLMEDRLREGYRLMLIFRAVAGHEPNLRKGILKADVFSRLSVLDVGGKVPVRPLRDLGDYKATRDVRDPITMATSAAK